MLNRIGSTPKLSFGDQMEFKTNNSKMANRIEKEFQGDGLYTKKVSMSTGGAKVHLVKMYSGIPATVLERCKDLKGKTKSSLAQQMYSNMEKHILYSPPDKTVNLDSLG